MERPHNPSDVLPVLQHCDRRWELASRVAACGCSCLVGSAMIDEHEQDMKPGQMDGLGETP